VRTLFGTQELQFFFYAIHANHTETILRCHTAYRFERELLFGTVRLVNFLVIFLLFTFALGLSDHTQWKRGVYVNLDAAFGFEDLGGITTRNDLVEAFKSIGDVTKEFLPLSSHYFENEGDMVLLHDLQSFSGPMTLNGVIPQVDSASQSFSIVAWVSKDQFFQEDFIVRKQASETPEWEDLSCWALHLDYTKGPSITYGAHDIFDWNGDVEERTIQVTVASNKFPKTGTDTFFLLTMVVNGTTVRFYENLDLLGSFDLPQPVTDCPSDAPSISLGESGLTLGEVQFYASTLSAGDISDIFTRGAKLALLASGYVLAQQSDEGAQSLENLIDRSEESVKAQILEVQSLGEVQTMTTRNQRTGACIFLTYLHFEESSFVVFVKTCSLFRRLQNHQEVLSGHTLIAKSEGAPQFARRTRSYPVLSAWIRPRKVALAVGRRCWTLGLWQLTNVRRTRRVSEMGDSC